MAPNEIALAGCSPAPLANYLKALGVLRLIESPTSSVSGIAADPEVRGWWENECFHLHTRLDYGALTRFFLRDYVPSPVIAPWNGGSGFYPGDNKDGFEPFTGTDVAMRFALLAGAVQTASREINRWGFIPQLKIIIGSQTRLANCWNVSKNVLRFRYQVAAEDTITGKISIGEDALRPNRAKITDKSGKEKITLGDSGKGEALKVTDKKITSRPKNSEIYTTGEIIQVEVMFSKDVKVAARPEDTNKTSFVAGLRGCLADVALDWLDAALALSGDRLSFPQLLGTGGNDGRLDFTNNFMQRLASTFDVATGNPMENTARLLRNSLFNNGTWGLGNEAIGQFAPGSAGGPNGSTGFEAGSNVNPWDFILALEGTMMFAGAATRRHQGSPDLNASFPFTVRPTGAGWGGVGDSDENNARAEFWAPLWDRPAGPRELEGLLKEGRAVLNGKTARDGLDFARAAASLGTSRGICAFARYGFVMRSGKAYLATPLGTLGVASNPSEEIELISDLDAGGWLNRVRQLAREKGAPVRARRAVKQLEDALFDMSHAHVRPSTVQAALRALGSLVGWLADSRETFERIPPPPRLSYKWVSLADDGTPEYRVAAALASLGWRPSQDPLRESSARESESSVGEARNADTVINADATKKRIALAAHFAPLDAEAIPKKRRKWDARKKNRVVWSEADLESNLISVLQRRLIDETIAAPMDAATPARLMDIAAFLNRDFDDAHCALLLAGLVWAESALWFSSEYHRHPVVPFAYAALKPLFAPDKVLKEKGLISPDCVLPIPQGLISRLRSGRVEEAMRMAFARARASGIACPFAGRVISQKAQFGRRLAAALLIPIDDYGLRTLMERAYPTEKENEDVA